MRHTLLGHSGLRVSEVALGTMTFGTDWGWGCGTGNHCSFGIKDGGMPGVARQRSGQAPTYSAR